jgi:predicted nucleotidyltransferase
MRRLLQADPRLRFALVFGSVARGTEREDSDLDLALGSTVPLSALEGRMLQLAAELSRLNGREVQLVPLTGAPLALRFAVAGEGKLLWARDPREVRRFRAQAFIEHADMEPMASLVRRAFFARVAREGHG